MLGMGSLSETSLEAKVIRQLQRDLGVLISGHETSCRLDHRYSFWDCITNS